MKDQFIHQLKQILSDVNIRYKERMEYHTSLHIGGEADYLVTPGSINEIREVILLCQKENVPYYIMGNGSNLLVADQGFRGLIVKLGENFSEISIDDSGEVTAQGGVLLSKLANKIAEYSLTGFEFASGIPGSLGGAVTMNAGAYDGEMKDCLRSVKVLDTKGIIHELSAGQLQLGYRTSILQKENYILLEAVMSFEKGDSQAIRNKMKELNTQRRDKQPLDEYSAGSTFKRPKDNYASKLIHEAGLRGHRIGGAEVSTKHSGFLINKNNATAQDFIDLVNDVIRIVYETFGVQMEPEIRYLGFESNH